MYRWYILTSVTDSHTELERSAKHGITGGFSVCQIYQEVHRKTGEVVFNSAMVAGMHHTVYGKRGWEQLRLKWMPIPNDTLRSH